MTAQPEAKPVAEGNRLVPSDHFVGTALSPEEYKQRRETLLWFVKFQMTEAEYDAKGRPIGTYDYYKLPGSDKLVLSKKGGELLGETYKYKVHSSKIVESTMQKDYVHARAEVVVHRSGIIVGAATRSCSSAEKRFKSERTKAKYGGDYRAAINDVEAIAEKRAFVAAMIKACAASDILEVADDRDDIQDAEYEDVTDRSVPRSESNGGPSAEKVQALLKLVGNELFTDDERERVEAWVNSDKCTPELLEEQLVKAEDRIAAVSGPL